MDSVAAPIVVSGDSSSESEEPSNVPVVPSSSTAANSSSPAQSLLERFRALSSRSCHECERSDRIRAHRAVARRPSLPGLTLSTLPAGIQVHHYPNLQAIAQNLSGGNSVVVQQLVDIGKAYIAPGLQYFHDRFSGELSESVASFKAAATLACCS